MNLGVDANGVTSALTADSTTRDRIVTLGRIHLISAIVSTNSSEDITGAKSGMDRSAEILRG